MGSAPIPVFEWDGIFVGYPTGGQDMEYSPLSHLFQSFVTRHFRNFLSLSQLYIIIIIIIIIISISITITISYEPITSPP